MSRINTAIEAIKPVLISFEAFCFYLYPRYFKPTSTDSWNAIKKIFLFLFNDDNPVFPSNEWISSEFLLFFFYNGYEDSIWFYSNFGNRYESAFQ